MARRQLHIDQSSKSSDIHISQLLQYSSKFKPSSILTSCLPSNENPDMETYEVFCTSPQQFQHSSSLFRDAYDSKIDIGATDDHQNRFSYHAPEEENRRMNNDDDDDNEDDSLHILKGFLKEVDLKGHKVFKKFVSRFEKDIPIERILKEALHEFKGKTGSDMLEKILRNLNRGGDEGFVTERGVDGEISQEELKEKLERFKVKTVNVIGSGVVKEEGH